MAECIALNQNVMGSGLIVSSAIEGNVFRVGEEFFVKFAHHKRAVEGTGRNHRDIHLHNKTFSYNIVILFAFIHCHVLTTLRKLFLELIGMTYDSLSLTDVDTQIYEIESPHLSDDVSNDKMKAQHIIKMVQDMDNVPLTMDEHLKWSLCCVQVRKEHESRNVMRHWDPTDMVDNHCRIEKIHHIHRAKTQVYVMPKLHLYPHFTVGPKGKNELESQLMQAQVMEYNNNCNYLKTNLAEGPRVLNLPGALDRHGNDILDNVQTFFEDLLSDEEYIKFIGKKTLTM